MDPPQQRLKIALIEDDALDRRAILKFIQQHDFPYDIQEIGSYKEATEFLGAPECDLALLDYDLRDGSGLELLPHFLEKQIPVIFVTGKGSEQLAVTAMRLGASDYLRKDSERDYLEFLPIIIRNVLSRWRAEKERDRLLVELQEALETIQTLRGLIPICTMCKKVRDDEGFWHSVEDYISRHSLAQFSHGYCPACFEAAKQQIQQARE